MKYPDNANVDNPRAREQSQKAAAGLELAASQGLEVIDARAEGGKLWVVDPHGFNCRFQDLGFVFSADAGPAAGRRAAWFLPRNEGSGRLRRTLKRVRKLFFSPG